jgi:hypothetical protein
MDSTLAHANFGSLHTTVHSGDISGGTERIHTKQKRFLGNRTQWVSEHLETFKMFLKGKQKVSRTWETSKAFHKALNGFRSAETARFLHPCKPF